MKNYFDFFEVENVLNTPISPSICVDGAWNCWGENSPIEWQAVEYPSGKILFKHGPFKFGTNNVAEFLAITDTIRHCHQNCINVPIYSDSSCAIGWVKNKRFKSCTKNPDLLKAMQEAVDWLKENKYTNPILKWQTKLWGENPADFGRK